MLATIRKYYYLGGRRIAMRVEGDPDPNQNGLFYFHSDHLGSTSVMSNESGGEVPGTLVRFLPFGEYRPGMEPSANLTDHGFTGHKHNDGLGLIYMNARFYVPGIGRFASADTIVPHPFDPQSQNRYSYTRNNPLGRIDPSGHDDEDIAPPNTWGPVDWSQVGEAAIAFEVFLVEAAPPVGFCVLGGVAAYGVGQVVIPWAIADNGPDYPLPYEYAPGAVQSTYPLPGTNTLTIESPSSIGVANDALNDLVAPGTLEEYLVPANGRSTHPGGTRPQGGTIGKQYGPRPKVVLPTSQNSPNGPLEEEINNGGGSDGPEWDPNLPRWAKRFFFVYHVVDGLINLFSGGGIVSE